MTASNFDRALSLVLQYEGGYADHPRDPGGATNMGITHKTLARWRNVSPWWKLPKAEVKALDRAEAAAIYRASYWNPVRADALPGGLDLVTFDAGVNSGPARSVRWLQAALGETQDGAVGPITLDAARKADAPKIIKAHCAKRLGFVKSLAIWNTFGKGWSRRIASVEATALSWVLTKAELEAEAKKAADQATKQGGGAVVVAGGGVTDQAGGITGLPLWAVALLVGAAVAVLIIRIVINRQRADALGKVAKETI